MRFAARAFVALCLPMAFAACGQRNPTPDPTRVLHIVNRTTSAIAVDISSHDLGGGYGSAVRPCADLSVVAGTRKTPSSGDLLVMLMVDPNRNLDLVLSQSTTDPYDINETFGGLSILWSTGEIKAEDLPRWIVVTPVHTTVQTSAPVSLDACGPLPSPEPTPTEAPAAS